MSEILETAEELRLCAKHFQFEQKLRNPNLNPLEILALSLKFETETENCPECTKVIESLTANPQTTQYQNDITKQESAVLRDRILDSID